MRLRQVALVARDLEPVVADVCAVFGVEVAFRDPGVAVFGLHNALMPFGDTFLEVVSPVQANTTAGRLLERRGGDGGYMVIIQTDDLDADRERLGRLGVRIVWGIDLEDARTVHLHPRDVGGAIVSLDSMVPPASWRWAGPSWQQSVRTDVVTAIAGVEIQGAEPLRLAQRWSEVLGRPVVRDASEIRIALDQGTIRFVTDRDGRGEGVGGIDVAVRNRAAMLKVAGERGLLRPDGELVICGTRIALRAA